VLRFDDAAGLGLGLIVRTFPERDFSGQTVEGLFDQIEKRLQEDAESAGRRNYATASFTLRTAIRSGMSAACRGRKRGSSGRSN